MAARPDGLTVFDVWGDTHWCNQDVVGESHYASAIRALMPPRIPTDGIYLDDLQALLWPEPRNAHDPNAVAVVIRDSIVGYLPRDVAATYTARLQAMMARGLLPATRCRVRGFVQPGWGTPGDFGATVWVALPPPHHLEPVNNAPQQPYAELPPGPAIQVTGEEDHVDHLRRYARPEGEAWAWVTLHPVQGQNSKTFVEVRLDGQTAGRLSPKMSTDMLPAVQHVEAAGKTTAARAIVKGNQLRMEVVVYAARVHELTADWFTTVGPVSQAPAAPVTPPPPAPPAGWYPDPSGVGRRYWDGAGWTEHTAP